ncbi:uncharacterized protein [Penaeus vannamei]|uniref:uncharacterized protein n=1 Tax=Penaeus vannamei TaxID=6689 RepID=UPI00387F90C6
MLPVTPSKFFSLFSNLSSTVDVPSNLAFMPCFWRRYPQDFLWHLSDFLSKTLFSVTAVGLLPRLKSGAKSSLKVCVAISLLLSIRFDVSATGFNNCDCLLEIPTLLRRRPRSVSSVFGFLPVVELSVSSSGKTFFEKAKGAEVGEAEDEVKRFPEPADAAVTFPFFAETVVKFPASASRLKRFSIKFSCVGLGEVPSRSDARRLTSYFSRSSLAGLSGMDAMATSLPRGVRASAVRETGCSLAFGMGGDDPVAKPAVMPLVRRRSEHWLPDSTTVLMGSLSTSD